MRTKFWVLALLLLGALAAWWSRPSPIAHLAPREGPIVALGDSLSAGYGSASKLGYLGLLEQRLGVSIVNKSISGNTSSQGLERLQRDVLDLRPALVILELGGNDFLQKVPPEETFANLDSIVSQVQAQGAPVLVLAVQSGPFSDKSASRYRELARKRQTGFVENIMAGIFTNPALKYDPIHPNDDGYKVMADHVEPELRRMLRRMNRL